VAIQTIPTMRLVSQALSSQLAQITKVEDIGSVFLNLVCLQNSMLAALSGIGFLFWFSYVLAAE
jgi:hypothetical protein